MTVVVEDSPKPADLDQNIKTPKTLFKEALSEYFEKNSKKNPEFVATYWGLLKDFDNGDFPINPEICKEFDENFTRIRRKLFYSMNNNAFDHKPLLIADAKDLQGYIKQTEGPEAIIALRNIRAASKQGLCYTETAYNQKFAGFNSLLELIGAINLGQNNGRADIAKISNKGDLEACNRAAQLIVRWEEYNEKLADISSVKELLSNDEDIKTLLACSKGSPKALDDLIKKYLLREFIENFKEFNRLNNNGSFPCNSWLAALIKDRREEGAYSPGLSVYALHFHRKADEEISRIVRPALDNYCMGYLIYKFEHTFQIPVSAAVTPTKFANSFRYLEENNKIPPAKLYQLMFGNPGSYSELALKFIVRSRRSQA